ncbi:thyroid adenoma-associated protein homolog isoform X2 [Nematostella vectensis]|uniref:thyroid adenoma-associated protein homolog isoform X2 n=1 Tax=Nematostella vectensis TaxID=45351 RepID=UPI002076DB56|nr:thyroid adenoma-associated protein homolog isoform X2 [Nematostella vectensis]
MVVPANQMEYETAQNIASKYIELCSTKGLTKWLKVFATSERLLCESSQKMKVILAEQLWKDAQVLDLRSSADGSNNHFGCLEAFAKMTCKTYIENVDNLKLFQRIQKIMKLIQEFDCVLLRSFLSSEVLHLISPGHPQTDGSSLKSVSTIIQNCSIGRDCIKLNLDKLLHTVLFYCENMMKKLLLSKSSGLDDEHIKVIIKSLLHMPQFFPEKVTPILLNSNCCGNNRENLSKAFKFLFFILYSEEVSKECILLSGKTLTLYLNLFPDSSVATNIILQLLTCAGVPNVGDGTMRHSAFGEIQMELPLPKRLPLSQVAILQGCLATAGESIVLSKTACCQDKDLKAVSETFLVGVLFDIVYKLCTNEKVPVIHYLAFEVLKDWFSYIKRHAKSLFIEDAPVLFSIDSSITSQVLTLVWGSLEDPVEGVSVSSRQVFKLLLEVHYMEHHANTPRPRKEFYQSLVTRVVEGVPWHVKTKYGLLCDLLPYIGLQKFMEDQPRVLDEMVQCLSTNQLSAASTELLKTLLLMSRVLQKESDLFKVAFERKWQNLLLQSLTSDQRMSEQHARVYWLPCALRSCPDSLTNILQQLSCNEDSTMNTPRLLAYLCVLKTARSLGIAQTQVMDESMLRSALSHGQDEIRSEALGVICSTHKTAEPLSTLEDRLLRGFLLHNLNIANPAFRQDVSVGLRKILTRVRDSSLSLLRKSCPKLFNKKTPSGCAHVPIDVPSDVQQALQLVGWISGLSVRSLVPGSGYQRQKTCLELIAVLLQTFDAEWDPDKKKGRPPEISKTLVSLAKTKNFFNLTSSRNTMALIGCLESAHSDIREASLDLLQEHFPSPFNPPDNTDVNGYATRLMRIAADLMLSARMQECESGSALCQLLFEKYVIELNWQLSDVFRSCQPHLDTEAIEPGATNNDCALPPEARLCIEFLVELLAEAKRQFSFAKCNLVHASQNASLHGVLLGLSRCIVSVLDGISRGRTAMFRSHAFMTSFNALVGESLHVASGITQFMLSFISRKSDSQAEVCGASFAGMKQAVDDALIGVDDSYDGSSSLRHQRELVMSCCFSNIKAGSSLLSSVAERVAVMDESHADPSSHSLALISPDDMTLIADTLMKICTQCRHWGILLSCKASLLQVCRLLTNSTMPSIQTLPRTWLDHVIAAIATDKAGSSVTRRSAGLPVLTATVLACESPASRLPLVQRCIETLIDLAYSPLPDVIDETTDLPQVHAINILRALYQDTSLSAEVLMFAARGVILAITGFLSPSWAVRNAATQLFGSLVLRIFGHKQGQQDDSQFNSISARDFFTRFPSLRQFFLRQLRATASPSSSGSLDITHACHATRLGPELFPILSMLSKLRSARTVEEESLLVEFIPLLKPMSSSPVYAVRSLAAQALVPFVPINGVVEMIAELLNSLPVPPQAISQNAIHGTLLQVRKLASASRESSVLRGAYCVVHALRKHEWLGTAHNACAVTREEYLRIVMEIIPLVTLQACDAADLVQDLAPPMSRGIIPGNPNLQHELARINICLLFDLFWAQGQLSSEEITRRTKVLLATPDIDSKIAILEYLRTNLDLEGSIKGPLAVEIASLIVHEESQQCLLVELDVFTALNTDECHVPDSMARAVWKTCISHSNTPKSIAVSSRSIPVCSILLRRELSHCHGNPCDRMVCEWSEQIARACPPDCPEPMRMGAARGLEIVGQAVLKVGVSRDETGNQRLLDACVSVFRAGVMLMEDEEEDIRTIAGQFSAQLAHSSPIATPSSINSSVAMETIFDFMANNFWWCQSLWVTMETMVAGTRRAAVEIEEYKKSRPALFESEDTNQYAEPFVTAQLANFHLKVITDLINVKGKSDIISLFSDWLAGIGEKLLSDVTSARTSDLLRAGSLQNPKPFYVWYRLLLIDDVIQCALSRFGTDMYPGYDHVMRGLMDMLADKKQVILDAHPILTELTEGLDLSQAGVSTKGGVKDV